MDTLTKGLQKTRTISVDNDRTIDFMGDALRVYATPKLVHDVEHICRDLLLEHLDEGEDSVGTRVEIDHLAPTMAGMWAEITVTIANVEGRLITFEVTARDAIEQIAKGKHVRFAVDVAKTAQRLTAKAAKAAEIT